jgi:Domain of Unknown Function (DUF1259)
MSECTSERGIRWSFVAALLLAACGAPSSGGPPPATAPSVPSGATPTPGPTSTAAQSSPASAPPPTVAAPAAGPPIDEKAVGAATGVETPEKLGDVVKVSYPRKDVPIAVDGWKMPPFMGLTSWAAFSPGQAGKSEAMVMGDLVLLEDEVNPVMSTLLDSGVEVTALHNHFFFDVPHVFFMHIGGEGSVATLGKGVRAAIDKVGEIRKKTPKIPSSFGGPALPAKSTIDAAKVEGALGIKGQSKDGMYKAVMGRETHASCGCPAGKAMGVNTWAAFAGSDENAVVDGDFAVAESELQPVLKALRGGGINVVAIHQHMLGETPRILFLHYWGRGKATDLASTVKKALDLTAWDGKGKTT